MGTFLALGSAFLRWHDELRRCGIAPDGCTALKLVCCEVQYERWPCLGKCSGQRACGDPPQLEVVVRLDAARALALPWAMLCSAGMTGYSVVASHWTGALR